MLEINERLQDAINAFNQKQLNRDNGNPNQEVSPEENRRLELKRTLDEIRNPNLDNFLLQQNAQNLLDKLGSHKSTRKTIRGIAIMEFDVPKINRRFGYHATLAYLPPLGDLNFFNNVEQDETIAQPTSKMSFIPSKTNLSQEIVIPKPNSGIAVIKEIGIIGTKEESGSIVKEKKVEIITEAQFDHEGVYETILTPEITPETLNKMVAERFTRFIQTLTELS